MAKCFNCGAEYNGQYCPDCGTANPNSASEQSVSKNYSAPQQYTSPQQNYNPPPVYNNVSVVQQANVTGVGGWVGWMFLCSLIPIIGQIIMLCCSKDESAKNFAKAQLIFVVIGIVLLILAVLIPLFLGMAASSY